LDMSLLEELEFFKGDDSVASSDFQIELVTLLVVKLWCFARLRRTYNLFQFLQTEHIRLLRM
jgi:hypothetical protein